MCAHSEGFKNKVPRSGLGIMGRLTPLKMLLNTIRPFRMSRWRGKAVISRTDRAGAPTAASLGMVIKTPCQESGVVSQAVSACRSSGHCRRFQGIPCGSAAQESKPMRR